MHPGASLPPGFGPPAATAAPVRTTEQPLAAAVPAPAPAAKLPEAGPWGRASPATFKGAPSQRPEAAAAAPWQEAAAAPWLEAPAPAKAPDGPLLQQAAGAAPKGPTSHAPASAAQNLQQAVPQQVPQPQQGVTTTAGGGAAGSPASNRLAQLLMKAGVQQSQPQPQPHGGVWGQTGQAPNTGQQLPPFTFPADQQQGGADGPAADALFDAAGWTMVDGADLEKKRKVAAAQARQQDGAASAWNAPPPPAAAQSQWPPAPPAPSAAAAAHPETKAAPWAASSAVGPARGKTLREIQDEEAQQVAVAPPAARPQEPPVASSPWAAASPSPAPAAVNNPNINNKGVREIMEEEQRRKVAAMEAKARASATPEPTDNAGPVGTGPGPRQSTLLEAFAAKVGITTGGAGAGKPAPAGQWAGAGRAANKVPAWMMEVSCSEAGTDCVPLGT